MSTHPKAGFRFLTAQYLYPLVEIDQISEHSNKEAQLADVLSPVSKKKTGRAYVALARAHSEK